MTIRRPPRLAEWLLARCVWPDERASVLGDLGEEFQRQSAALGGGRAGRWYWGATLRLGVGLTAWALRLAGQRLATIPTDDVRYAWRRLRRQPLVSAISVGALALAIGASAATWSLVSAVLLHPLPLAHPDRLVRVDYRSSLDGRVSRGFTFPAYTALHDASPMRLAAWGTIGPATPLIIQGAGVPRPGRILYASADFAPLLDVHMARGRFFDASEDQHGASLVAVLSDQFWRTEFGADPNIVGRIVRVRDRPIDIIGVAPRGFRGLDVGAAPDLILPLHAIDQIESYPDLFGPRPVVWWIEAVGRLPEGATIAQTQDRLDGLQLGPERKTTFELTDVETASLTEKTRLTLGQFTRLLGTTVALLLAIGSITVGMLLVLRTDARRGELATCLALGATRIRVVASVFVEGALLAVAGAVAAVPVSQLLFGGIRTFELPGNIRIDRLDLALDNGVLAGTALAAFLSIVVITGVASLVGLRRLRTDALRLHGGVTPRLARGRARSLLVSAQVAVTLVLVIGAGLFAKSVVRALSLNPGIDTDRLFEVEVPLPGNGYTPDRQRTFVETLRGALMRQPAIASVGVSASWGAGPIALDGIGLTGRAFVPVDWIDDRYFSTLGLPIISGRTFRSDDRAGAPPVAIVTKSLAKRLANDRSLIGHSLSSSGPYGFTAEVVGVVSDLAFSPNDVAPLGIYRPLAQMTTLPNYPGAPGPSLMVRARGDVPSAIAAVTTTVNDLDPHLRLEAAATIEAGILDAMGPQRFGMTVMGALGAIALFLCVLGTYVLAESMAALRRREMGIRAALGAPRGRLRVLLLSDTCWLVGAGLALGIGLSWLGSGLIRGFLFQVEPFDPAVSGSVAALVAAFAVLATLRPAIAAGRVDVAGVLRED